ncbi:MAG: glycosyl transferase family 90 [Alphaproteobacteria bacterium]
MKYILLALIGLSLLKAATEDIVIPVEQIGVTNTSVSEKRNHQIITETANTVIEQWLSTSNCGVQCPNIGTLNLIHQKLKTALFATAQIALFSYNKERDQWSYEIRSSRFYKDQSTIRAKVILSFLNGESRECHDKARLDKDFSFLAFLQEPGIFPSLSEESCNDLSEIFKNNFVLTPCTSPAKHPWSQYLIAIPDFFTLGNDRQKVSTTLMASISPFKSRTTQCFFIGGLSGPFRPYENITEIEEKFPRLHYCKLAHEHRQSLRVAITNYEYLRIATTIYSGDHIYERFAECLKKYRVRSMQQQTYAEQARYAYLLSMDGFGAAWGRVPGILATGSVLLMQAENKQWFYPWLKAYDPFRSTATPVSDECYIPIRTDLSNLVPVVNWLNENPGQAKRIGENGRQFAEEYLKANEVELYFESIIKALCEKSNSF